MCLHIFKYEFLLYIIILFLNVNHKCFSPCILSQSINLTNLHIGFHPNHDSNVYHFKNKCKLSCKFLNGASHGRNQYTFITSNRNKSYFRNDSALLATNFHFDERAARRARHMQKVNESRLRKKLAKKTMRKIVESVTRSAEENKDLQVQKFISEIQYNPNRKRLPVPPEIYSPSYDALLYLKGIPYRATEKMVLEWLKNYDIVSVVFIKNENGFFTGDAYVRCQNLEVRDKAAKEMANKMIGGRYIQVFRVNENAYLEYYHSGCRKEPKDRNYIDPSVLVITNNQYHKLLNSEKSGPNDAAVPDISFVNNLTGCLDISDIKTGVRLVGTVTEIYRNGVIVDCNICETRNGVKEKVFCILKKNRIAKNIGMQGQQHEWLRTKQLVLYPGIRLNLYVEKVRETTASSTFDQDMWTEHFHNSLMETYFDNDLPASSNSEPFDQSYPMNEGELVENSKSIDQSKPEKLPQTAPKRSLVYLTMDSSVSEDKVLWWEKKILTEALAQHKTRNVQDTVLKEAIKESINSNKTVPGKVKVKELHQGNTTVYGNQPNQIVLNKDESDSTYLNNDSSINNTNQSDVLSNLGSTENLSSVNESKLNEFMYETEKELPDDVPIANLLNHRGDVVDDLYLLDGKKDQSKDRVEFFDLNYKKLTNKFFQNTTSYDKDIKFHDFEVDPEYSEDEYASTDAEETDENYDWTLDHDSRISLDSFPKLSLNDGAIKIPPNGLILRASEVYRLENEQIKAILELLNKDIKESYDENRDHLIEVINSEGIPNDMLPQTLIQRGLQKVKQSKKYMKNIVNLTKDLTGRIFSQEDLDAASTEELQMLVEEGLYKFLNWNPPYDIKKQFITNYHHLLEDNISLPTITDVVPKPEFIRDTESADHSRSDNHALSNQNDENVQLIEKMWNDMKWLIVIFIYGEKNDLEDIVRQIESSKMPTPSQETPITSGIESKED